MMYLPMKPTHLAGPLVLFILCSVLVMSPDTIQQWFIYQRDIALQSPWRFISANLAHTNFSHYLLNMSGLLLLWVLHGNHYRTAFFLINVTLMGVFVTFGTYLFDPDIFWYMGLSGVLHGLFVWGSIADIKKGYRSGWLLLGTVIAKIFWEQSFGADEDIESLINSAVAINAHLYGAVAGLALSTMLFWQPQKQRPAV